MPGSPWRDAALALLIAGFGAKMGLVPLNGWMPLAYAATPIPAAAVLSGAGVKAGVIGLIRFLPLGVPLVGWGEALAVLGFVTAFYGVLVGITQENPKAVLAYSSVSQMGVIAAALGMGLAAGDANASALVAFYAANHVLVKGALFLTVGAFAARGVRPESGAARACACAEPCGAAVHWRGARQGGLEAAVRRRRRRGPRGGLLVGSALLMLHFVSRLPLSWRYDATGSPAALVRFWPAAALGALVLPYLLFPFVSDFGDALALVEALGRPLARARRGRFSRSGSRGSLTVCRAFRPATRSRPSRRRSTARSALGALFDRLDATFRRWPAAGLALLAIVLALVYTTVSGG